MDTKPQSDEKKMTLRLPAKLAATVSELAEQEHRSLHGQILALLEEAVATRQAEQANKKPFTTGSKRQMFRTE